MTITSKSNFLNNADDLLSNVITNKHSMTITTEEGNAVLIPEEKYRQLLAIAHMLKQQ